MTLPDLIRSLLSGAAVGFSLGLIGGGGSILAVPALLYVVGIGDPHRAIGTSALSVATNAYINVWPHARRGNVIWPSAILFALAGAVGAFFGSSLGKAFDGRRLLMLFALLMLLIAALMQRRRPGAGHALAGPLGPCGAARVLGIGAAAGLTAGFFGIGGGFLIVPGLILATGMSTLQAIGSSLVSVGTFGLTTALNYAASGLVDWGLAATFIAGGIAGGLGGARLAHVVSARSKTLLDRIFGAIVAAVAIYMLVRGAG
ncbi:MAG: sulfite exporter TauE/SafE family protein [Rhodospirillales bacterium]|nr:sulfite exporter TauE/SafE family protein [Rhodospirillales bacterium]